MTEIMTVNGKRRRHKKHSKKRAAVSSVTTTTRIKRRRNPGSPPGKARRAYHRAKGAISALQPMQSAKDALVMTGGALMATLIAKKLTGEGARTVYSGKTFAFGLLGAGIAGVLGNMVRPGMGHKMLTGGLMLLMYKAFIDKMGDQFPLIRDNFQGENDTLAPEYQMSADEAEQMLMGAVAGNTYTDQTGEQYIQGADGYWQPADDRQRLALAEDTTIGWTAEPGSLGDAMVDQGRLGDPWARMANNNLGFIS